MALKLIIHKRPLTVVCVYVRNKRKSKSDGILEGLRSWIQGSLVVWADMNARAGNTLAQISAGAILQPRRYAPTWSLRTQGIPTFFRPPDYSSAIDITFHSPELPITWHAESNTERSDHFPIHIGFGEEARVNTIIKNVICWNKFRAALLLETGDSLEAIIRSLERATKRVRIRKDLPDPDFRMHQLLATRKTA